MLKYTDLNKLKSFQELRQTNPEELKKALNGNRIKEYDIKIEGHKVHYNYATKQINENHLKIFQNLSDEANLIEKYKEIINGNNINISENRKVLHHLTRGQLGTEVIENNENMRKFFQNELERIFEFAKQVQNGLIKSISGKIFKNVVQIGIGGSSLGPKALYTTIKNYANKKNLHLMKAYFISNVDPDEAEEILSVINLQETLFIIVSKSGNTLETESNMQFLIKKLEDNGINEYQKQIIIITSKGSMLALEKGYLEYFFMHDSIGGRFSPTSAVGLALITLCFTENTTKEILKGAHEVDKKALNKNVKENAPLLAALISVYESNILNYSSNCILAYSKAMENFYLHLQQLEMESNGKSVNRFGEKIDYKTVRIIWGGIGTDVQHSFFQMLHQGTEIVPMDLIGFSESQLKKDITIERISNNNKLKANLIAQIVAFSNGKEDINKNKNFEGERPSSLIYSKELTPYTVGAILSHYENKVMFEGFLLNINSFDQEGVQLGKTIAKKILKNNEAKDEIIESYKRLLQLQN
ncbi:glucose-6-phosphate isomerase [Borrelia miyamotoi]|uniref:Glucose-6-phosphate isomerase n=1 Tax=Borrelia miyamotoi TaxID=47466 RepID=A0AAQ3AGS9_9SPIR|nr:glucose-6-phosphate isomerase [Borrelia miyamotoi]AGT27674.1 glucose-6-phosphate isomerase [Borrelia miyamotoi LB-2001]AJA58833.1 glucose-6-phosphate isomerase [Borrelia miyamotoi]AOW95918.1 glucose-6-phosphate isomerase [Borrelia miyamotoi]QTL83809.1 glucose-6-phosphate isomerase [Borrelia miyamotoi]WAZ84884.1 glucose-6-phosphate isomerase [Borrelia miyamotoi]